MTNKIDVLNHGHVILVDHMGNDLSIVRSARTSYDADWRAGNDAGKDKKLIQYLVKHKHHTPLEAVTMTFQIKAPIFVFRQWHRHRIGVSYNEMSARYTELPREYYIPELDRITTQASSNKQMSSSKVNHYNNYIRKLIIATNEKTYKQYENLLELDCPRELARTILPVGMYSKMFFTCNLRSLMHFYHLRSHPHAQYEIKVYADAMLKLIEPIAPIAVKALLK